MQPDHPHLRRDFVGYGSDLPHARWPGDARIALNLCVNYEEGGELSVPDGDEASESALTEGGGGGFAGRDLAAESMFEYGSRVGFWRVARLLQARGMPATIFGCGLALERNPQVCAAIRDAGWDVCAHGWRWERHQTLTEAEERERIRRTVASIEASVGARPLGWYCRYGPSVNTRRLVAEEGGFLYDSDAYNDELPYYVQVHGRPHLVLPYGLANNDAKFIRGGMATGQDFFEYLKDAFDMLYREGAQRPRMMSVGLHLRLVGHPGARRAWNVFWIMWRASPAYGSAAAPTSRATGWPRIRRARARGRQGRGTSSASTRRSKRVDARHRKHRQDESSQRGEKHEPVGPKQARVVCRHSGARHRRAFRRACPAGLPRQAHPVGHALPARRRGRHAARALAKSLSEAHGATVVVENRAGAGGTIGTASVAKAAPDGYTLLLGNVSTLATAPSLYTKLTYDPLKDFTPLTLVGRSPLVFAVNPGVKANNLKELIAAATAQPGALDYGSSGAGSITHLTGELLNVNTKGAMVHVPYKGSAPVVMAMVSGELDMGVTQVAEMLQQYRAKQVRALAITGNQRLSAIPEVPTAAEAGVTGLDATTWYAVVAPQGLPQPVIDKLQPMLVKALDNPDMKKRFAEEGLILESSTPEALKDLMRSDIPKWAEVVKRAGVKLD